MELLDRFLSQMSQLQTVWMPFVVGLFIVGVVIWRILKHHYQGRLDTKDDLIKLKDGQVQDYKDKLSGATPDEARQQIDDLQQQVGRLTKQRKLTPEQRKIISERVAQTEPPGENYADVIYLHTAHETAVFADDIAEALRNGGWSVHPDFTIGGQSRLSKRGLAIAVPNMNDRAPYALALGDALEKAGLSFGWEVERDMAVRLYVDLSD
jgi:hypothetical protein